MSVTQKWNAMSAARLLRRVPTQRFPTAQRERKEKVKNHRGEKSPKRRHLEEKLRITINDEWSWVNPLYPGYSKAIQTALHFEKSLTREQLLLIVSAAENYLHIVGHPSGVESVIKQLRQVIKVLRENER